MMLFDIPGEWLHDTHWKVWWQPGFLAKSLADEYFQDLMDGLDWQQGNIQIFGKRHQEPRLSAYYGDAAAAYTYSQRVMRPLPWAPCLAILKTHIEQTVGVNFNAVLCNLYRDGRDSMGWHSDDEKELGSEPVIASLSLGEKRRFIFREKLNHQNKKTFELGHGDLLVMTGDTQQFWQHQIPKTVHSAAPRINLTFRSIKTI